MAKKIVKFLNSEIFSSMIFIVMGLCLLIFPIQTVNIVCKLLLSVLLIGTGAYHLYNYISEKRKRYIMDLFTGVIVLVMGFFLFMNSQIVVMLLPVLLGSLVLVDSVWILRGALKVKNTGQEIWKAFVIIAAVDIVLGIILMINPFKAVRTTILFAGIVFVINGIGDLFTAGFLSKLLKKPEEEEAVREEQQEPVSEEEFPSYEANHPAYSEVAPSGEARKGKGRNRKDKNLVKEWHASDLEEASPEQEPDIAGAEHPTLQDQGRPALPDSGYLEDFEVQKPELHLGGTDES